ncbi:MAG: hypothetical protein AAFO04_16615 [Cyanobacteria bacterium J06592_8]
MSQNLTPMEPLSVGNVVTAALRIYRDHFKSYFGLAILASLWSSIPFLVIIPVTLLFILFVFLQSETPILFALIPLWLLLLLYCLGKSIVNGAIIARLVFGELTNQPETVKNARQIISRKIWSFLLAYFLLFLIVIGVLLGVSLGVSLGLSLAELIFGFVIIALGSAIKPNYLPIGIIGGIIILIRIVTFAVALRFFIRLLPRFFVFDMPLVIEENVSASQTIGRSWKLTKGYVGKIFAIWLVATLVSLPFLIIIQIIAGIIQAVLSANLPVETTDPNFEFLSFLIAYTLGIFSNILLLPFWQAIKAVIYYDLRTRREGMRLELRKREV